MKIIRPILRGRDIKRYQANWAGLWLIDSHNGHDNIPPIDIENYPAIKAHLNKFLVRLEKRQDKGITPYNLRNCAYHAEFSKEKIVYPDIMRLPKRATVFSNFPYMCLDKNGYFAEATNFILTSDMIRLIFAILSSKFGVYTFVNFYSGPIFDDKGFRYKKTYLENFPIPLLAGENCSITSQIESLVDCIFVAKPGDPKVDTSATETEIDQLVYQLYNLTDAERGLVESWLALQR